VESESPKWLRAAQAALVQFKRDGASGRITLFVSRDNRVLHVETVRDLDFTLAADLDEMTNREIATKLAAGDRRRRLGQVEVFEVNVRKTKNKTALEIIERIEI
jgi:hypothetical protein